MRSPLQRSSIPYLKPEPIIFWMCIHLIVNGIVSIYFGSLTQNYLGQSLLVTDSQVWEYITDNF